MEAVAVCNNKHESDCPSHPVFHKTAGNGFEIFRLPNIDRLSQFSFAVSDVMAEKITIECPACLARLNLSDPSKLGKKIKCPKCQEIFTSEALDSDDMEDEDDESKSPSSRKRAAGGSKGSSKKGAKGKAAESSSSSQIVIGAVAVIAIAGVGLYLSGIFNSKPAAVPVSAPAAPMTMQPPMLMPQPGAHGASAHGAASAPVAATAPAATSAPVASSAPATNSASQSAMTPAEKALGLRWLPQETDLIIHAKVSDIMQAPLLKGPLSDPGAKAGLKEFEKLVGIGPADIESVTVGVVDLMGAVLKMTANRPAAPMPGFAPPMIRPEDNRVIAVVKSKKPIDLKQIAAITPNAKMQERSGKSYVEIPSPIPGGPSQGAWLPDPNTIISATTNELFAAMDRGETALPRIEFASIDPLPQVVIAAAIRPVTADEIKLFESREKEFPGFAKGATKWNDDLGLQLAQIGLTIKGGFDLKIAGSCRTAEGASKLKTLVEGFVTQAKFMFAIYEKTAPPLFAELGQILLSKLNVTATNDLVSVSTGVPDTEQAKLEQLPATVMMMAMTGGFNNLGGPPGGGAGGNRPFMPLPGETPAVDAVKTEGLPDGLKLSAKTAWSIAAAPAEGTNPISLEIVIDVTGNGLEGVCGGSGITTKTMTLDGGGSLKKVKRAGGGDALKQFTPFDYQDLASLDHPPQTLRVRADVEAPAAGATKIDVLEGTFKILTSSESKEFSIEEVPKKIKRPLTDPDMKALEIKLRRGPTGVLPETFSISCAKENLLGKVVGNPGNISSVTEVDKDQTIQRLVSTHEEGKFPDDFEIKFTVYPQVKEQTVTFRFENVPLPTPDSKPQ